MGHPLGRCLRPQRGIPPADRDGSPIARAKAMTTSWQVVCSETPQTTLWIPSTQTFSSIPVAAGPQACWVIAGWAACREERNQVSIPSR